MAYSEIKVVAFPGAPNLPIFAALDNGYFKDEGVQIDFSTTPSSVYQFEALAAGTVWIALAKTRTYAHVWTQQRMLLWWTIGHSSRGGD